MTAIKLSNFGGLTPIIAHELLPHNGAQAAFNCVLDSGDIIPLRNGTLVFTRLSLNTIKSFFRIDYGERPIWLTWDKNVTCVRGPIFDLNRYYYTGDGEPRVTTPTLASLSGDGNYPSQCRAMGVPNPFAAPIVSVSGGVLTDISRYYCYTFIDDWGQESAPSPVSSLVTGKPDGIWTISGMDVEPHNSGYILDLTYLGTQVTITSNVRHFNRVGDQIKIHGVVSVTNVNGVWTLTDVNIEHKTMTFKVRDLPSGEFGEIGLAHWSRIAPFGPCVKRLYRTSGITAQFQLVADNIVNTTYIDTLSDGEILGDELISGSWEMPPTNLKLIGVHPCGSLIGFVGNELRVSEPYQPHAWPKEYTLRLEYPIVAGAIYDNNIVVGTTGTPYTVYGNTPEQFTLIKHNVSYPCVSARSMVAVSNGAVYASFDGLVQVSSNGVELLTGDLYSKDQWERLSPTEMIGAYAKGVLYYAIISSALRTNSILIFSKVHTVATIRATAFYVSPSDGRLYYAFNNSIYEFNKDALTFMMGVWESKEFYFKEPKTFTAAKILYDPVIYQDSVSSTNEEIREYNRRLIRDDKTFGEVNGSEINAYAINDDEIEPIIDVVTIIGIDGKVTNSIRADQVLFELYADKEFKYRTVVSNNKPFRLPSGYRASRYSVRVLSVSRIKAIEFAENPIELKNA